MRVTNNMISDQVMRNLDRSLNRFMRLQVMMSTGKKILRPSDSPIGTQKDLKYRRLLSEISQYRENIASSINTLRTYDTALLEMKQMVTDAYETAVNLANDTFDDNARDAAADTVKSHYQAIINLINTRLADKYIFSGYKTNVIPFRSGADGVEYMGDRGDFRVEIEAGARVGINIIGADVLLAQTSILGENADLKPGIDINTLLADLNLGKGVDQVPGTFTVTDHNTGISVNIDISTAVTVADVITTISTQLAAGGINSLGVDLGLENNNLRWVTTNNGQVTLVTPIKNLNNGNGVDQTNGKFKIHDAGFGIDVEVDVSAAVTVGDVINAINNSLTNAGINNVTAALNAAGTGIDISDTNGVPLGLSISEINASSTTAGDLGILGNIDPILNGADMNPQLDFSVTEGAADQTTAADLGLAGDVHFDRAGQAITPILKVDTPLSLLRSGLGLEWGEIKISQGSRTVYLDLNNPAYTTIQDIIDALNNTGLDIQASINDAQTGLQIESLSDTASLKIEEVGDSRIAHDLGVFGSPDIMGSLMILIDALENNASEDIAGIIGSLENGIDHVLTFLGATGSTQNRLETTDSRLTDMDFNYTILLSDVEDADLTKVVSDLALQENSYQAALIAASKIIQPSLIHFLD